MSALEYAQLSLERELDFEEWVKAQPVTHWGTHEPDVGVRAGLPARDGGAGGRVVSARKTLADVALVDLGERARIVRHLCRATGDVDERCAFVELAFIGPADARRQAPSYPED